MGGDRKRTASAHVLSFALALGAVTGIAGCTSDAPGDRGINAYGAAGGGSGGATGLPIGATDGELRVVRDLSPPDHVRNGLAEGLVPNDLILIDFFQLAELDRKMRIDSRGMITMPLIGDVRAGGRSTVQLEQELERRYGAKYLENPEISVLQIETKGRIAYAGGEFERPGAITLWGQSSLTRVISQAGGLNEIGDPKKIFVFREVGDRREVARYSLKAIHDGIAKDPQLYRDDVVVAFSSKRRVAINNLKDALGIAVSARRAVAPF